MGDLLHQMAANDLRDIAQAIRDGRLYAPFSAVGIGRYCSTNDVAAVTIAAELQQVVDSVDENQRVADLCDLLATEKEEQVPLEDRVQLVCSGPEGPGAASRATGSVIRELFGSATRSVLVSGFAVYQGQQIFRVLAERMDATPTLKVQMFLDVHRPHGDRTDASELLAAFSYRFRTEQWPGNRLPEVYYDPRSLVIDATKKASLHAKCIVIDNDVAFVSSANFTEAAQERNIEVGVSIQSPELARELSRHFASLAENGLLKAVPGIG